MNEENKGKKIRDLLDLLKQRGVAPDIAPGEPVPDEEEIKRRILLNKKRMQKRDDEASLLSNKPRSIGRKDLP